RSVDWLLAQPPSQGPSRFPNWSVDADHEPHYGPSRVAWCYGDLGVSAALLRASRCVDEPRWEKEAIAIARKEATRFDDTTGIRDAGLCHGTAGVAHIFNRMFQATGDVLLGDASRFWFERTLMMRQDGAGIAGYRVYWPAVSELSKGPHWEDSTGFLSGA